LRAAAREVILTVIKSLVILGIFILYLSSAALHRAGGWQGLREGAGFGGKPPAPSVNLTAELGVTERASGTERRFPSLKAGQSVDLESFKFTVVELQPRRELDGEPNGPAALLEYVEDSKPVERFWVFQDFQGYDATHRRGSAQNFALRSMDAGLADPAARLWPWVEAVSGLAWLILTMLAIWRKAGRFHVWVQFSIAAMVGLVIEEGFFSSLSSGLSSSLIWLSLSSALALATIAQGFAVAARGEREHHAGRKPRERFNVQRPAPADPSFRISALAAGAAFMGWILIGLSASGLNDPQLALALLSFSTLGATLSLRLLAVNKMST
jgi:hypothetical protein